MYTYILVNEVLPKSTEPPHLYLPAVLQITKKGKLSFSNRSLPLFHTTLLSLQRRARRHAYSSTVVRDEYRVYSLRSFSFGSTHYTAITILGDKDSASTVVTKKEHQTKETNSPNCGKVKVEKKREHKLFV